MIKKHPKNAFTLIELLAVILILGIIALIAIPTVNKILKEAKINASISSGRNYIKAVETKLATMELKDNNIPDGKYLITDGNLIMNDEIIEIEVKGNLPNNESEIFIENNKIDTACLTINNQDVSYNGEETVGSKCK